MAQADEIEFVFEPQEEGGYHVSSPDLPGLHTQGDTLEDAKANAREALAVYGAQQLRELAGDIDIQDRSRELRDTDRRA